MSVQSAFKFIQQLRGDRTPRHRLLTDDFQPDLDCFVKFGEKMGLMFTVEDLKTAHKHDLGMRWLFQKTQLKDDR